LLFGTFNTTGATAAETRLSKTFQTMVANFVKNPTRSPAPNFPKYNLNLNNTLAKLAFNGNVEMGNAVQVVSPSQFDEACLALWDQIVQLV
jgi:carboxylesterase 2